MDLKSRLVPDSLRNEVTFEAVLSRGPGGQNVNRTASAAQLYWDFRHSRLLTHDEKERLAGRLGRMINVRGEIFLRSDESRDLERNKARCLEKLRDHVVSALFVPKKRKATKPTRSSKEKRHQKKSQRGEIKKLRRRVDY